jgi:hypothetical protein
MATLLDFIANPAKVFNRLKVEEKFPSATFIILLAIALINMILNIPITTKVSELVLSDMSSLSEEQVDMAVRMTYKMRYLTMTGGFIVYAVMLFVYPLILLAIARIFRTVISYTKTLQLIIFCFIAPAAGDLANTSLVYLTGIDSIKSIHDATLTGVNVFTSVEKTGVSLYTFLSAINPFQIWFVALLVIGIKKYTDSTWFKSGIICVIYWLIVTLFPIIVSHFSQMLVANKELV